MPEHHKYHTSLQIPFPKEHRSITSGHHHNETTDYLSTYMYTKKTYLERKELTIVILGV